MRSCLCCCVAQCPLPMYIPIAGGCYSEKIYLVEGGKSLFIILSEPSDHVSHLSLVVLFRDVLIVGGLFFKL